jgi:hypothetical protein
MVLYVVKAETDSALRIVKAGNGWRVGALRGALSDDVDGFDTRSLDRCFRFA